MNTESVNPLLLKKADAGLGVGLGQKALRRGAETGTAGREAERGGAREEESVKAK